MSDSRGASVLLLVLLAGFGVFMYPSVLQNVAAIGEGGAFLVAVLPIAWLMICATLLILALYLLIK